MLINRKMIYTLSVVLPIFCFSAPTLTASGSYDIYKLTTEIVASDGLDDAAISRCGSLALAAAQYENADDVLPLIVDLAELDVHNNYQEYIRKNLLLGLKNGSKYPAVLQRSVDFILQQLNTREEKTVFLEEVFEQGQNSCQEVASYAALRLSSLCREVFLKDQANEYLNKAVKLNPLNVQANEELIAENSQDQSLKDKAKLLKLKLELNPYDFKNAFLYAMFLRQYGKYDDAVQMFGWTADVFEHFTDEYLSADIYIPWIETLNAAGGDRLAQYNLIMERLDPRTFDIRAESYRVRFDPEFSLEDFEKEITAKYLINDGKVTATDMAWFYAFVKAEPEKSFDYSKKAYIQMPAKQHVRDIYTYNLMKRGDYDRVNIFLNPQNNNQAARLAMGQSHVNKIDYEMIRLAADSNPLSYEGLEAISILSETENPYSPQALDKNFQSLAGKYGPLITENFAGPSEAIDMQISTEGVYDTLNDSLTIKVSVENILDKPLYIRNDSCFTGGIILSCSISGDLEIEDAFILNTIRQLSKPLMPGEKLDISFDIGHGNLFEIIKRAPQARLIITPKITLLSDIGESQLIPLKTSRGSSFTLQRIPDLNTQILSNNYKALSSNDLPRQITAASFFADLYIETVFNPAYKHTAVPKELIVKSIEKALEQNVKEIDIRVLSKLANREIPESLETMIIRSKLSSSAPEIRLLSAYILKTSNKYKQLLSQAAQIEQDPLVKSMLTSP
ncbi:hypothetical protein SMSP2_00697 [Limihaloglobus sulfuriphilus]|uniref:Uncharacterized protein n=1 Tax=Limihaloglobus sulfuriphilus TaxID=1851148 RepID=A0A1Q2MDL0_9BACT|nr:hypothetical protein [Limihaloglobus sulfuriphilus]AQQ70352.1 hypothetical protein SMSP2_00697 [Limihaloglobus sulfuriphilus]